MNIFHTIADDPCFGQEEIAYQFFFFRWKRRPKHNFSLVFLYWNGLWWEVSLKCNFCEISHTLNLEDAEVAKIFKLRKMLPRENHRFYHLEEIKQYSDLPSELFDEVSK